jgi:hypothetical protein
MSRGALATFLLSTLLCTSVAAYPIPYFPAVPVYGTPPTHVRDWLRIIWAAPMTHPVVPAYFFVGNGKAQKGFLTAYVAMTHQEYRAVVRFTEAAKCSTDRKVRGYKGIAVEELSGSQLSTRCVFTPETGCPYLFGLAKLPDVDWSRKNTYSLFQFESELGCSGPFTPWHDEKGRSP